MQEENKKLCDKYPFLTWYGDPLYMGYNEEGEPDYSFTWEDEVSKGWRKAFCPHWPSCTPRNSSCHCAQSG